MPVVPLSAHNELLEALELLLDDPLFSTRRCPRPSRSYLAGRLDDVDSDRKGRWLEFALFNSDGPRLPYSRTLGVISDAVPRELLDLASSGNYFALLNS